MKLTSSQTTLRKRIITALKEQGFKINPHVRPSGSTKTTFRRIQKKARLEQISRHKSFLEKHFDLAKTYCRDGKDIVPEAIELELREVKSGSFEEILFRWWNFIWWSIPYQCPYGRQMRFLLWDTTHDAPFGLIGLQSPVLSMSVRDKALGIPRAELDVWVNRSMNAQRVGALPPYNQLLGGKMVALSLTSNEIRDAYKRKYKNYVTILKARKLKADLLFITTTSAFGRSSLYNRLKYNKEIVAECKDYTQGSGTFHIPESLYEDILAVLESKDIDISRNYGHGPSKKLRLISQGLSHLGLPSFEFHGIKRAFYIFPLVKNLKKVIQNTEKPRWHNRPFRKLTKYWKKRWAMPRMERFAKWHTFEESKFSCKVKRMFKKL